MTIITLRVKKSCSYIVIVKLKEKSFVAAKLGWRPSLKLAHTLTFVKKNGSVCLKWINRLKLKCSWNSSFGFHSMRLSLEAWEGFSGSRLCYLLFIIMKNFLKTEEIKSEMRIFFTQYRFVNTPRTHIRHPNWKVYSVMHASDITAVHNAIDVNATDFLSRQLLRPVTCLTKWQKQSIHFA